MAQLEERKVISPPPFAPSPTLPPAFHQEEVSLWLFSLVYQFFLYQWFTQDHEDIFLFSSKRFIISHLDL